MTDDTSIIRAIDVGRLFVSAVGFWASFSIWMFLGRRKGQPDLIVALRRMFAAVSIVLFVATGANIFRVAYGTEVFAGQPLIQLVVGLLYAAMTVTAVRFYWQLTKR